MFQSLSLFRIVRLHLISQISYSQQVLLQLRCVPTIYFITTTVFFFAFESILSTWWLLSKSSSHLYILIQNNVVAKFSNFCCMIFSTKKNHAGNELYFTKNTNHIFECQKMFLMGLVICYAYFDISIWRHTQKLRRHLP